jgi:hypothetical protein
MEPRKIILMLIVGVFFPMTFSAQIYRSCTCTMEFERGKDTLADARASKTYMILNTGSGEFNLKIDLNSVVTQNTLLNAKFADLEDQYVVFKGNYVGQANELVSGMNDERNRSFAGTISMNSISQACNIIVQSVNYADKTESKSLKLDIIFILDPIKLNVPILKDMTKDPIEVEITGGYVNLVN